MKTIALLGRILFCLIFIMSGFNHFSDEVIKHAQEQGVPLANIAVPVSGVMAILGGLSILLGFKTKWGAWLIIAFLIPVTFMMHNFWSQIDQQIRHMQMIMFMKNISILGGALLIAYHGADPVSLDVRRNNTTSEEQKNGFFS